jgi:flagellar motility protein MotE (MotC chaperone)
MPKRKTILALGGLGAASFAVSAAVSVFLGPKPTPPGPAKTTTTAPASRLVAGLPAGEAQLSIREKELQDLIRELQARLQECDARQKALDQREQRLVITQELLKKQIQDLEDLQVRLLGPLNTLKEEQAKLDKGRLAISRQEQANLKKTALIYEKMDPGQGGKILADMCKNQQLDDAVKILHYMGERAAAGVFAEMTDKTLAAKLTARLKEIQPES